GGGHLLVLQEVVSVGTSARQAGADLGGVSQLAVEPQREQLGAGLGLVAVAAEVGRLEVLGQLDQRQAVLVTQEVADLVTADEPQAEVDGEALGLAQPLLHGLGPVVVAGRRHQAATWAWPSPAGAEGACMGWTPGVAPACWGICVPMAWTLRACFWRCSSRCSRRTCWGTGCIRSKPS